MAKTVFVSAISQTWQQSTNSFYERLAKLMRMSSGDVGLTDSGELPLHIVVAPEYYFRRSPLMVINELTKTYHGFRGVDKTDKKVSTKLLSQEMLDAYEGPKWISTLYSKTDCEYLQSAMCVASAHGNTLIVPGTIFWAEREPLRQSGKKRSQRNKLIAKGVARNTTFAFHKGNLLDTYNKHHESHELDDLDQDSFVFEGGTTASVFTIDDLKIGVEICADHSGGVLKSASGDLDIHILVSDGMTPTSTGTATRRGGIVVACDTLLSSIWQDGNVLKKGMEFTEAFRLD
jgi:hypothetical protein